MALQIDVNRIDGGIKMNFYYDMVVNVIVDDKVTIINTGKIRIIGSLPIKYPIYTVYKNTRNEMI